MKRLLVVLPVALVALGMSACAVGAPKPTTDISDTAATLNGEVYSSVEGDTTYSWQYGETDSYGTETPVRTVAIADDQPHPVSEPISGLTPNTVYHFQLCVQDTEEDPPRDVCSEDQSFTTDQQDVYVALGDSVTQWGAENRYPERFFNSLNQAGVADVLQNLGQAGQTSSGLNGGQLPQAREDIDDPDTDATVITIDIGANDILNVASCDPRGTTFDLVGCQPTLNQFATNFAFTLSSLNTSLGDDPGDERVIVMAYYNPWSGRAGGATKADQTELVLLGADRTLDCSATDTNLGLNDRIACLGADHGAHLVDAYPSFIGHGLNDGTEEDYMSDDIHPNEAGHQVIADLFAAALPAAP